MAYLDTSAKPLLLIVTGRPGAGKTTLSQKMGNEFFMPVVSRDSIKEGYVHTFGKKHNELPTETNGIVNRIFSETLMCLISNNVSVIAEAAFQHQIWVGLLAPFIDEARIFIIICAIDGATAVERFVKRGFDIDKREYFHGDKGVDMARKGIKLSVSHYDAPRLDTSLARTIYVDTTDEYVPSLESLGRMIFTI